MSAKRESGIIKYYNHDKGYGFVSNGQVGDNLFFHVSAVAGSDEDDLDPGIHLSFERGQRFDGRPCAINARIIVTESAAPGARRRDAITRTGGVLALAALVATLAFPSAPHAQFAAPPASFVNKASGGGGSCGTTVSFLTSGTSFTVPANCTSSHYTVECIAGGSGGANGDGLWVGGGGEYRKLTNVSLTAGGSVPYSIGAAGVGGAASSGAQNGGTSGGDTSWNSGALLCKGGTAGNGTTFPGPGGTGGTGGTGYNGGTGGTDEFSGTCYTGAGAGGAGGPSGVGAAGGNGDPAGCGGGGGGGGGGGTAGSTGSVGGASGGTGTAGSGNGGTGGAGSVATNGNAGANGTDWDASHGSGGGAGSGSSSATGLSGAGGTGGLYGGAGGVGGYAGGGATYGAGGNGAPGIIVVTYAP